MDDGNDALRILIQFLRVREADDPYDFRFAPQEYILPTAGGSSPIARFDWTPAVLADLQALRQPGPDPAVLQRFGERLRRFIQKAGWAEHEREIAHAIAARRPVFLTIRSSAAELYTLPWELLTLKSGQFIGKTDGLLIRYEWPESKTAPEHPRPRPEGGRILLAWSAAGGAVPAAEHLAAISSACAAGFHPFHRTHDVLAHASLGRIIEALAAAQRAASPIAVLHILCHGTGTGSTFGLCLDGDSGPVALDAAQVRDLLAPFAAMVRLIVLSVCDSGNPGPLGSSLGSLAQTLHRCGFQSVLASRFPLSVAGSVTLTKNFYTEILSAPASLEASLLAARRRLAREETDSASGLRQLDWASVQLYARHEEGDDTRPVVFRPFRGLLAFQPEHRRFFYGREKEVREILTDLQALIDRGKERFFIIAGASGTGKSSLVFAGAVPALLEQDPHLQFLRMRPGNDPEQALNDILADCPAGGRALLVVDQFEELFTQTQAPARQAFVRRLWSLAAAPEPGVRVLITLRVDFIGRCGELAVNAAGLRLDRIAYDEAYRVFIAQLEPAQLRTAIVEPVRRVGLELPAGLSDRMLEDVGSEPGALPLLEDVLDVLWQQRSGRELSQTTYEEIHGIVGALRRRADAILDKLSKEDLEIAQRLLVSLVAVADDTTLDTRLRVSFAELQLAFSSAATGFERVLKELVAARLLVHDGDEKSAHVEVAHEALIRKWPKLRAWLDEDRAGLVLRRRVKEAAQQWERQGRDESLLFRGGQLAQAALWRKTREPRLGGLERQFLDAGEALRVQQENEKAERQRKEREAEERLAEERRQKEQQKLAAAQLLARRTRFAALVLVVLFLGAAGAGIQAWLKSQEASRQARAAAEQTREARRQADEAKRQSLLAKQKSDEAHDGQLTAVAQIVQDDPTEMAAFLRESGRHDWRLWTQYAIDALHAGIAETVLRGHTAKVTAVAFSPDGSKVLTGSADKTARIWNADGFGPKVVFEGHGAAVTAVAFSSDGKKIVTGSADATLRIWRADGVGPPVLLKGHVQSISSVGFTADNKAVFAVFKDASTQVWNVEGGPPTLRRGHIFRVTSVLFNHGTSMLLTRDNLTVIKNGKQEIIGPGGRLDDAEEQAVLTGHDYPISSVAFSADETLLVTGAKDQSVRVWRADGTGEPLVLQGGKGVVSALAFSPDGKKIVSGSLSNAAYLWNADGSGMPRVLQGHKFAILAVAFSPDGRKVVTGSEDQTAQLWNAEGTGPPIVLQGHRSGVYAVAFSPDGKRLVTGSGDNTARIWNISSTRLPVTFPGIAAEVTTVAFSADGSKVITTSSDHVVRSWQAEGSETPLVLNQPTSNTTVIAISPDGKKLIAGFSDKTARIWNTDGPSVPVVLSGHEAEVAQVAFSPDGKKVSTSPSIGTTRIWNADGAGAPLLLTWRASSTVFSPNGKKIVTWDGNEAMIWSAEGAKSLELKGHEGRIRSAACSPDGTKILTGGGDTTARIWNAAGGTLTVLNGHKNHVQSVAFSPDGSSVATGSDDNSARIWGADGSEVSLTLNGHRGSVLSVAFSPDGKKLVTGSADGTARIWILDGNALLEALWEATSDCVSIARRQELLLESDEAARQAQEHCRQEVARRRGRSATP